ncbi:MAG: hypothetical protein H6537_08420 [Bacteroidales bacterium]|nr:hypothetical protein [Bacteroidales bacterium]HPD95083.1 hypothetical protein [Tenuifilaceae bacterium]HRX30398.1 hypothetical protein [Tenuifilaceae bacterium]
MKKYLLVSILSVLIVATGCVSKKYAKRGVKYEQAGMWELAAESYMRSLSAKRDNIDALTGLKRTGQKVLDEKALKVVKAYESDDLKSTVYGYIEMENFANNAKSLGVELIMSDMATGYFNDAKPKYIEKIYGEAQQLLEAEKFKEAEVLLNEVKSLAPDYGDVKDMLKVSKCEPLYRQGKTFMGNNLNRKAYYNFDKIVKEFGDYKDAADLKKEALDKALITISVNDFTARFGDRNLSKVVQGKVVAEINSLNNPFIKIVDTHNTNQIIQEQQHGAEIGANINIGKMLAAKAILNGELIEKTQYVGKLSKTRKKGYVKEVTKVKKPNSEETETKVSYKKVYYWEYETKNYASMSLKYQLTSTETGAVMVTDLAKGYAEDALHYVEFDGPKDKLVPGSWEKINKDSPNDVVSDSKVDIAALRDLLDGKREIISLDKLNEQVIDEIASQVSGKIDKYDPEK